MSGMYEELAWLLPQPVDFGRQCKALENDPATSGAAIRAAATAALDINGLARLAKTIRKLQSRPAALKPLNPFRLCIISNGTTDYLEAALIATAPRFGISLEVISTAFDQAIQEAIDPRSLLHAAKPDAVLVALDYRGLGLQSVLGDSEQASQVVDAAILHLKTIQAGLRRSNATGIFQTLATPPELVFGSIDANIPGTLRSLCDELNTRIRKEFSQGESVLVDCATLAETVGLSRWHDPMQWGLARLPCALTMVPLYADHVCRTIAALRGLSRRVLVLDLDNTLWGGVIGDDGIGGIAVSQGDATGEAHLALQHYALELRKRGIVLAVCSKNDDDVARRPFKEHPDMILKEAHFAIFQANWTDKASNIEQIANSLELGLDSFVFVDDNPVERELVRQKLPGVAVPELPADPALYVRTLAAAGYFEATAFTEEDRKRAAFYQGNAQRLSLLSSESDLDSYLESLSMKAVFAAFDDVSLSRVTQLINKSNQFNLTTRRYTEAEVAAMELDPSMYTLQVRLADKFGDNGLISVVICRRGGSVWNIDTWLMSCRVLKRRVEEAVLNQLVIAGRQQGITELSGRFIPTGRNGLVQDHYANLGFTQVEEQGTADESTTWHLRLDEFSVRDLPIEIVDGNMPAASL